MSEVVNVVWTLSDDSGGLARAAVLVASAQARAGHQVTLAATTAPGDLHTGLDALDPSVEVRIFPRGRLTGRFAGSSALGAWLEETVGRSTIVHTHAVWDLASQRAARTARRRGARLLISPHGSLDPYDLRKHATAKRLLGPLAVRRVLGHATVVCTSQREADLLVTFGAAPAIDVVPLPLVAEVERSADPGGFRRRLGVPTGVPLLLFLGRVDPKKGLPRVFEAMRRMRLPAHLVVVGDGDPAYVARMRTAAETAGIGHRVTWAGWRSGADKAAAFEMADLFVLWSDAENYGLTVVEAIQHGTPVCATEAVDIAAELARYDAVRLAPPDDPAAAAEVLDACLDDATNRRLREAGASALRTVLSPPAIDAAYARLLAPGREGSDHAQHR